jgi:hypothetical protein
MLQFSNKTPFSGTIFLSADPAGIDTAYTVVRGTFVLTERLAPADDQVPVSLKDEYHGEPATSSIKRPSDAALMKPGTDVVLLGHAHAPQEKPTWQMDVSLAVGPVAKTVRVSADRVWESGAAGAAVAWVEPFVRMPLVWERAYGGNDETEHGPSADPRNPVGRGFRARTGSKPLAGLALPNLEDPASLVTSPKDAPAPAGFAPIAAHWEPRKAYAGTYDEAWQARRAPYLPADFDPRFFQIAAPGLTAVPHLQGGEPVEVLGATPSGSLRFQLPRVRVNVTYLLDNSPTLQPASLDTVIVEPDVLRLTLVWRAALACDKKALRINAIEASLAPL